MSWNTALIGKAILATAIVSVCPSVALSDVVPVTLLATGNVTIPSSPSLPESITFTGVPLIAGQTYWVAVLPLTNAPTDTSGASWQQNPGLGQQVDFTGDGVNWGASGWGPGAYPGEFDVIGSASNVLFTNFAANPFSTGHSWGVAGANANPSCGPNCYNGWASYFTPTVSDTATEIDVVLYQNNGYDPYATVSLYTSSQNISATPEPAEGAVLGGCLMLLLGARSWYRRTAARSPRRA